VKGTNVYPHMLILRNDASLAWSLRLRVSTVVFTSWWAWPARWPIRPILGKQSSPKFVIPCLGRRRTAEQNVTLLALSSAEKSVTVQTNS